MKTNKQTDKALCEAAAKQTLARMKQPKLWRIRVWENCCWHYCLEHKPSDALLTVWPGYLLQPRFSALLSLNMPRAGDVDWSDHYHSDNPNNAVVHVLLKAKAVMRRRNRNFNRVIGKVEVT